jgi:hypothetical protein
MAEDLIRYDVLAQEALRGLVKKVLSEVAKTGIPGEHHFFITFDTRHPGVRISSRLKSQYPDEMTVVLQHQFWDLTVTDAAFEVGLSFKGVPEKLLVPFHALSGFVDPHASFGLKFDVQPEGAAAKEEPVQELPSPPAVEKDRAPAREKGRVREPKKDAAQGEPSKAAAEAAKAPVVSLDAFRKKNG